MTGNTTSGHADLAGEYLAYANSVVDRALDNSRQWAFDEMNRLVRQDPEAAWPVIVEIVRRSVNDRILAFVAAGPLEDLIRLHASTFIDRIEAVAKGDEQFRKAVSGAWVDDMPPDIEQRLTCVIGDGQRL
jgi:hypothetical protein